MHTNLVEFIHYSLEFLIDMFLYHKQLNESVCLHGK
jgi:hypothetical protein